jgi:hypothetical protein
MAAAEIHIIASMTSTTGQLSRVDMAAPLVCGQHIGTASSPTVPRHLEMLTFLNNLIIT